MTLSSSELPHGQRQRIVIFGCGFGGMEAARTLSDADV
jgi:NADH dehydrogenase FAD-containing subunit